MTTALWVVQPACSGLRLDVFLAQQKLPFSRSQLARRIEAGEVTLDNKPCKPGQKVRAGQTLLFVVSDPAPVADQPENIPLVILYEDRHLLVVDKPAHLVVHPAPGHPSGTLVNALLFHCGTLPSANGAIRDAAEEDEEADEANDPNAVPTCRPTLGLSPGSSSGFSVGGEHRPGIVHRLDAGTSGVLVCAKDEPTLVGLQAAFQQHTIERRYLALVEGEPPARGTFHTRYGRHPRDRKRFTSKTGTKHAVTHFEVLERFKGAALIECRLETGRTHQIRVHLSEHGFPLLGDPLYGEKCKTRAVQAAALALTRQALHARLLGFVHPVTQRPLRFETQPPEDFAGALEALRRTVA